MNRHGAKPRSFLLADCGSTTTTVALFDRVEDDYRLIARGQAPTTIRQPWQDVLLGIQWATEEITKITGRSLQTEHGELISPEKRDGTGVDFFGLAFSATRPLRVMVAGLLEDVSVASARRALQTIYAQEVACLTPDTATNDQELIQVILQEKPELIFISGGADGSEPYQLLPLLDSLELSIGLVLAARRPDVLYAGNNRLREHVTAAFGGTATVHIADNIRPSVEVEQLGSAQQVLANIFYARKIKGLPGMEGLDSWTNPVVQTSAQGFATMIDYFGALYQSQVYGVDLGSNHVTIAASEQQQSSRLFVSSEFGMGEPLSELLNLVEPSEILQWTPTAPDAADLRDFILNKALYPHTVALTEDEIYLEHALARVILQRALADALRSWGNSHATPHLAPDLVILRGNTLVSAPRQGQTVLTILDSLQPTGVFSLAVDRYGVLSMLGLLASDAPAVAVQVLEGGALLELGWVIAPVGSGPTGQRALRIVVESEEKDQYRIDAEFGELITVPLPPGASAELTLKPERKVDVGRGPGKGRKIKIHGGAVGLVVDMRGRPLRLPSSTDDRHNMVRQWHWDMGG